ncbi:AAA_28 domain-containing protein [Vibrio phage vB_VcorM_GR7B]|nr:AAA_28 domain-containing protein [Vibrio phage vB_VcorM_GR7B]
MGKKGIGFAGAHCTGKTTLVQNVSEQTGLPIIPFSVSRVFKDNGFSTNVLMSLEERMEIQNCVIGEYEDTLDKWLTDNPDAKGFLIDRTPLDFLMYVYGDISMTSLTDIEAHAVSTYADHCIALTDRYFGQVTVVQPGVPLEDRDGRGFMDATYIDKLNYIVLGALQRVAANGMTHTFVIPQQQTVLTERIKMCYRRIVEDHYLD